MHKVLVAYFVALIVTPAILSLEGTLLVSMRILILLSSDYVCFFNLLNWITPVEINQYVNSEYLFFMQAGRDLKFISFSMSGCFSLGALALLVEINFIPLACMPEVV